MDTTEPTIHYHCGWDCYAQHRTARGRCAHIGHFDHRLPCGEDCADECRRKRAGLGI